MTNTYPESAMGGPSSDETTWGMLCHLSAAVFAPFSCIVILVTKAKESMWIREQAVEALNFQITFAIANILLSIFFFIVIIICVLVQIFWLFLVVFGISMILYFLIVISAFVFVIQGAIKAHGGEQYKYPYNLRFIK